VVVEEERLPDGRYVLYYTWTHPGAADDPGDTDGPGAPGASGAHAADSVDDR
jgi:hypothetical protein